jgi:hypothetical protein
MKCKSEGLTQVSFYVQISMSKFYYDDLQVIIRIWIKYPDFLVASWVLFICQLGTHYNSHFPMYQIINNK